MSTSAFISSYNVFMDHLETMKKAHKALDVDVDGRIG
jgi:Ca2+-binding EF-hand superfamily protein